MTESVIGPEQLAYMSKRSANEGHLLINKFLELGRAGKLKGLMCCIDFQGAFDTVKHSFIFETLEKMNVGPGLISHIKALYCN